MSAAPTLSIGKPEQLFRATHPDDETAWRRFQVLDKAVRKTGRAQPVQIPRAHRADARMNTREDERDARIERRSLSG